MRALVVDLIAEGAEATVPPTVRETVGAVRALLEAAKARPGQSLVTSAEATVSVCAIGRRG